MAQTSELTHQDISVTASALSVLNYRFRYCLFYHTNHRFICCLVYFGGVYFFQYFTTPLIYFLRAFKTSFLTSLEDYEDFDFGVVL